MNERAPTVGSWQLEGLSIPLGFAEYADAYLDSAERLCRVLIRSTKKITYPRGAVVLYLAFHATELFLKALVLERCPDEKLSHDLEHYQRRYKNLYPGKKFRFDIPFKTEYVGFEPPEIEEKRKSEVPQDQVHRYPTRKDGEAWPGLYSFDASSFIDDIKQLKRDFGRIRGLAFNANNAINTDA